MFTMLMLTLSLLTTTPAPAADSPKIERPQEFYNVLTTFETRPQFRWETWSELWAVTDNQGKLTGLKMMTVLNHPARRTDQLISLNELAKGFVVWKEGNLTLKSEVGFDAAKGGALNIEGPSGTAKNGRRRQKLHLMPIEGKWTLFYFVPRDPFYRDHFLAVADIRAITAGIDSSKFPRAARFPVKNFGIGWLTSPGDAAKFEAMTQGRLKKEDFESERYRVFDEQRFHGKMKALEAVRDDLMRSLGYPEAAEKDE
jgi:hypothetical protein